jgi:hypothetical protein
MPGLGFAAGAAEGINDSSNIAYKQALMAQQRQQMAMEREKQLREQEGRKDIGQTLAGMYPEFSPAPNPGQSSAPPPVQAQGGGGGQPGVPGAAAGPMMPPRPMQPQPQPQGQGGPPMQAGGPPINMNFPRPGPGDNPNNAGPAPTDAIPPYQTVKPPEPQAQPDLMSAAAPPGVEKQTPDLSNAFSPQHLVAVMQKQGIPQERWAGVIGGMAPLFKEVSDEQQKHLEYEKSKASEAHQRYMELLGNRHADQADAREDRMQSALLNTVRHQGVTETQGDKRVEQGADRIKLLQSKGAAVQFSSDELDAGAGSLMEGQDPRVTMPGLSGAAATELRRQSRARAVEIYKARGVEPFEAGQLLARKSIEYSATKTAVGATAKRAAGIDVGTEEFKSDVQTMESVLDKVATQGGAKIINKPINKLRDAFSDEDYGVLSLVTTQVGMKYERALSGGLLSAAQLHAGYAEDAHKLMNGDMTPEEIKAKVPIMLRELNNASSAAKRVEDRLLKKSPSEATPKKTIVKTGTLNGKKVVQYSDGSTEYAD